MSPLQDAAFHLALLGLSSLCRALGTPHIRVRPVRCVHMSWICSCDAKVQLCMGAVAPAKAEMQQSVG